MILFIDVQVQTDLIISTRNSYEKLCKNKKVRTKNNIRSVAHSACSNLKLFVNCLLKKSVYSFHP